MFIIRLAYIFVLYLEVIEVMTSQYLDTPLTVGRARSPRKTDGTFCQVGGNFEDVSRKCRYNVGTIQYYYNHSKQPPAYDTTAHNKLYKVELSYNTLPKILLFYF